MQLPRPALLSCLLTALLAAPLTAQEHERTVYVPIEDFDEIFDREKGGVFVPYQELLELLRKAGDTHTPPPVATDPTPPADYVLVGAQLKGVAGERVVQFEATFDIEVLRDDAWVIVPIGLGEAALESVQASSGQRAVVGHLATLQKLSNVPAPPGAAPDGYGVIIKGAGRLQTTARFAVPISSRPGESSFALSLPAAALSNFEVTLLQSGLRVEVGNSLATEQESLTESDQTRVRAYFGAASQATVKWNPRPKQVVGEEREPLLFAKTFTSLYVDEGVLQATTRIDYGIRQAPCGEFRVRFPKGYTLLNAEGANMSSDPVPQEEAEGNTITIRLHEKVASKYSLTLKLERILTENHQGRLEFPRVETLGTEREEGRLATLPERYLTLEPLGARGLSQLDPNDLTRQQRRDVHWDGKAESRPPLAFRYLRQPYRLQLKSAPIVPEVTGRVLSRAIVRDDVTELNTLVDYLIEKRGIFAVRLQLPEGFLLGKCTAGQGGVKDYRVDENGVLQVDFRNQVEGKIQLSIVGELGRSADASETDSLALPRIHLLGVKKETGLLAVGAGNHLKLTLNERDRAGLVNVAAQDLTSEGLPHALRAKNASVQFGFSYSNPEGLSASFAVKRRESKVNAQVEVLIDAQENQIKVDHLIHYTVEFAGIESLHVRVPAALRTDEELTIEGDGIQEPKVSPPWKEGDTHVVWTIPLQGKRLGEFDVNLHYDLKLEDLKPGQERKVNLHEIEVLDVFTEKGEVALVKHENLVIREVRENMERIDKRELPESLRRHGPIQAYSYTSHPHQLGLEIIKYDFQAPLGLLVEHMHLDEEVTKEGDVHVEAYLRLKKNNQQYLTVLLPKGASFTPGGLLVHGRRVDPSRGSQDAKAERQEVLIPLGESTQGLRDKAFQIRLRYDIEGQDGLGAMGNFVLRSPEFPLSEDNQVPVARLTRSLYLPQDLIYREYETQMSKHFAENSLWEDLKELLNVRPGLRGTRDGVEADEAGKAAKRLKDMAQYNEELYPALKLYATSFLLFEKRSNPAEITVHYSSQAAFYVLEMLVVMLVVCLGVFLKRRELAAPVAYVAVTTGLCLLGANFGGKAWEPFFTCGLVGSLGLGTFCLGQALWHELTVKRHQRRLAELGEEAQAARARAQAAEAESRARQPVGAGAPATSAAASAKGGAALTAEERSSASEIPLDSGDAEETGPGDESQE